MTKKRPEKTKKSKKPAYVTLRIDEHTEILVEAPSGRLPAEITKEAPKPGEVELCSAGERIERGATEAFGAVKALFGKALDELKALDSDELQVEAGFKLTAGLPILTNAESNIKVTLKWKKSAPSAS